MSEVKAVPWVAGRPYPMSDRRSGSTGTVVNAAVVIITVGVVAVGLAYAYAALKWGRAAEHEQPEGR